MATIITEACTNCSLCEPDCPTNAISMGPLIYEIDAQRCVECVGFHDDLACARACPVDACVITAESGELEEALIARARAIFPDRDLGQSFPSHLRS